MIVFEQDKFVRAVKDGGLTKTELASIFEVSRQQVYNMIAGARPRNGTSMRRANIYAKAVCVLIDKRILPFPAGMDRARRAAAIAKLKSKLYDLARP